MIKEPWDIKIDDTRSADNTRSFIIFCEDGSVEPAYFEIFKKSDLHISVIGNSKQHHGQVDQATEYLRNNDLLEVDEAGHEMLKLDNGAQVWCVFDRDKEPNDGKDTAFNDSIKAAKDRGIDVAWSNDDFELWILLHFEDVDPEDKNYGNRKKYYERLTEILRTRYPEEPKFDNKKFSYYSFNEV